MLSKLAKALKAVSETRQALNEYQSSTGPDVEGRAEKVKELAGNLNAAEGKLNEACVSAIEHENTTEVRKLAEKIELRQYIGAAIADRAVTGAEAEYNKETGLDDRNVVPFAALLPNEDEERADSFLAPAAEAIQHPQAAPILRRVFKETRVMFLGARMPSVASGEPVFPIMTGVRDAVDTAVGTDKERHEGFAASMFAPGGEVESKAAEFTGIMVSPKRLSARYTWRIEDVAKLPIESLLRADLRMVMGWQLDNQVLNGDGAGANIAGIIKPSVGATLADKLGAVFADGEIPKASGDGRQATALNGTNGIPVVGTGIDGVYANTFGKLRVLLGIATYKKMVEVRSQYTDRSAWEALRDLGVTMEASAIIEAPKTGGADKDLQDAVLTSNGSDMVIPVWEGITMIRDPYSGAAKGETALTAHMLFNTAFLRKDAWKRINFKLA